MGSPNLVAWHIQIDFQTCFWLSKQQNNIKRPSIIPISRGETSSWRGGNQNVTDGTISRGWDRHSCNPGTNYGACLYFHHFIFPTMSSPWECIGCQSFAKGKRRKEALWNKLFLHHCIYQIFCSLIHPFQYTLWQLLLVYPKFCSSTNRLHGLIKSEVVFEILTSNWRTHKDPSHWIISIWILWIWTFPWTCPGQQSAWLMKEIEKKRIGPSHRVHCLGDILTHNMFFFSHTDNCHSGNTQHQYFVHS